MGILLVYDVTNAATCALRRSHLCLACRLHGEAFPNLALAVDSISGWMKAIEQHASDSVNKARGAPPPCACGRRASHPLLHGRCSWGTKQTAAALF